MFGIPSIYLWSVGSALFALSGLLIGHKLVKPIDVKEHQASLDATLNIVGTLVSILLGLLVAGSLSSYQSLEADAEAEAGGIAGICRLSFGLPADKQREILKTCLDYCDQVVNIEWPEMTEGRSSPIVLGTYAKLLKLIVTFNPTTNGQTNLQAAMLTSVQSVGDYRRQRILVLNGNWNKQLMPVLLMCSSIVLIFAYLYVRRGSLLLHGFLICFVATALGANLGLIYLLSNPFRGDWRIQPRGFEMNTRLIRQFTDVR